MIPTTSTWASTNNHNLYPDTPTKTTQDIKNEFNQKKCNFNGGIWDSTTNTCKNKTVMELYKTKTKNNKNNY